FSEYPRVASFAVSLVGAYCNTGNLAQKTGRTQEALGWFDRAVRTGHALGPSDLRGAQARLFLRNSHLGRAIALERLKRYDEALGDWEQTIRLDASQARGVFLLSRALCLARAGRHQRACVEAEKLAGQEGIAGSQFSLAARVLALAASAA